MPKTEEREREGKPKLLIHHYIKNVENENVKVQSELFIFETPKNIDNYGYQLHWSYLILVVNIKH